MAIKDYKTMSIIEQLAESFQTITQARYFKSAYDDMEFSFSTQAAIDSLTNANIYNRMTGFMFSELYTGIISLAEFVYKTRSEVLPNKKYYLQSAKIEDPAEKLREEMAADNLLANLNILADNINNLYVHVAQIDKEEHRVKEPVYMRMPELKKLGQLLTETSKGALSSE